MLMPKRVKHRKVPTRPDVRDRQRWHDRSRSANTVWPLWNRPGITSRQIEAARRAMTRSVKRGGKIWIRIFPRQAGDQEAG